MPDPYHALGLAGSAWSRPAPSWPAVHGRTAMGRPLAVVGLIALAVAACVAGPNAPTITPASLGASQSPAPGATSVTAKAELSTLVPWSPATAAPSPVPTPSSWPNGPACRPDQLGTAAALESDGVGLGGSYSVWNDAAAPCSLSRGVSVSILDASGHALSVSTNIVLLGRCAAAPAASAQLPGRPRRHGSSCRHLPRTPRTVAMAGT